MSSDPQKIIRSLEGVFSVPEIYLRPALLSPARRIPSPSSLEKDMLNRIQHNSDCAVHNEPAYPAGPCDCGAQLKAERRYWSWLSRLVCNQVARWRTSFRSWLGRRFLKQS